MLPPKLNICFEQLCGCLFRWLYDSSAVVCLSSTFFKKISKKISRIATTPYFSGTRGLKKNSKKFSASLKKIAVEQKTRRKKAEKNRCASRIYMRLCIRTYMLTYTPAYRHTPEPTRTRTCACALYPAPAQASVPAQASTRRTYRLCAH